MFASFVAPEQMADDNHSKVTATAVMKFNREQTNANYGLAFAVIENDVTGYKQRNAYGTAIRRRIPPTGWKSFCPT